VRVSPPTKKSTNTGFRADQIEHQRDPISVAGLGEAIGLVFGRVGHRGLVEKAQELRGRRAVGGRGDGAGHFGQDS
jgi:hypothetical protein